tara:strand:+ start:4374 stop:5453 length:1080 start_codon:yes stop_codon:yes gene_type:complete
MKISIVVCGKNDNYGGHFDERLYLTLKYNIKKFTQIGVETEIIFVEWNPIEDKPLLSLSLVEKFDNIKCFVVDAKMHESLRGPYEHMSFLEFFAKNVGIRRASGDYIICTNADVFYGDNVFEYIAQNELQDHIIYRTERKDIRFAWLKGLSEQDLKDATFRDNPVGGKPYVDASGDFTLASKKLFMQIQGYDENMRFVKIHKDSRILFTALMDTSIDYVRMGEMYHIDHEGSAVGTTGTLANYRPTNGPYNWKYLLDLPYTNRSFWGLSSEICEDKEVATDVWRLEFKEGFDVEAYEFNDERYMVRTPEDLEEYKQLFIDFHRDYLANPRVGEPQYDGSYTLHEEALTAEKMKKTLGEG